MWLHLLSAAIFIALSSCQAVCDNSKSSTECKGPNCSCNCPDNSCSPCPVPQPSNNFGSCGAPWCPCSNTIYGRKSKVLKPDDTKAYGISTVNVYPTGPICSAFNVGPNKMLTISTCIEGIPIENLFVTTNTPVVPLKVIQVLPERRQFSSGSPVPVLLITEMPGKPLVYYDIPREPLNENLPAEIHKWNVTHNGMNYDPTRTEALSHFHCYCNSDSNFLCAQTLAPVRMGWNDIGTPLVELHGDRFVALGIYIGSDLYKETYRVNYYSLLSDAYWLLKHIQDRIRPHHNSTSIRISL